MIIYLQGVTNYNSVYLNGIVATLKTGEKVRFDRDETDADFQLREAKQAYNADMRWKGVYIWDEEKGNENYDVPISIFSEIKKIQVEIEDDAPEDYYFVLFGLDVLPNGYKLSVPLIEFLTRKKEHTQAEELSLLNEYVTNIVECEGAQSVINSLIALGASYSLLVKMGFNPYDVKYTIKEELYSEVPYEE